MNRREGVMNESCNSLVIVSPSGLLLQFVGDFLGQTEDNTNIEEE